MIMLEVVLLLPNTDRLQQVEDSVRGCSLLPNTDRIQQVEDYVRGCTTSIKYWPPSTSWRLCQWLFYFYQILTAFNKLKIMLEVSHGNLKMLKLFTGFIDYQYLIDRGDNTLECFNRATNYYGLWQPVPVRNRTRETRLLSLLRLIGSDNEKQGLHVLCLSQWWLLKDYHLLLHEWLPSCIRTKCNCDLSFDC